MLFTEEIDFDFIHHEQSACLLFNKIIRRFINFFGSTKDLQKMPLGKLSVVQVMLFLNNEEQPSKKKLQSNIFRVK